MDTVVVIMIILLLIAYGAAFVSWYLTPKKERSLVGKHVLITGGSSGIGKCVAFLALEKGAHVTIVARDARRLDKVVEELRRTRFNEDQIIARIALDVADYETVTREFASIERQVAPIFMLVNCAGIAICGRIENLRQEAIKTMIDTNLLGTLYPIQAVVNNMKDRKEGIIVLTASQAALTGIFGYSVYSACKFALRGMAEAIRMELAPYKISITVALPPDTDTPGYAIENRTKLQETRMISASGGLVQPEEVAEQLLKDALAENFFSYLGFESFLLTTLCVGMAPVKSFLHLFNELILLGPFRVISSMYVRRFYRIVQKCYDHYEKVH